MTKVQEQNLYEVVSSLRKQVETEKSLRSEADRQLRAEVLERQRLEKLLEHRSSLLEWEKTRRIQEEGDKEYWRDRAAASGGLKLNKHGSGGGFRSARVTPW